MQEMQERGAQSLRQEDPLEEEMETHSSILALEIPWMEELVGHNWANECMCTHTQNSLPSQIPNPF